jgi:hypothetical protein
MAGGPWSRAHILTGCWGYRHRESVVLALIGELCFQKTNTKFNIITTTDTTTTNTTNTIGSSDSSNSSSAAVHSMLAQQNKC